MPPHFGVGARSAARGGARLDRSHQVSYDLDWSGAEKEFGRALELDPTSLDAHFFDGMLFMALERFPEAIDHIEKAEQLDPLSPTVQSGDGGFSRARRFDEAILHLNQAIELQPEAAGHYGRFADVYEEMGRYDEALAFHENENQASGRAQVSARMARVYADGRALTRRVPRSAPDQGSAVVALATTYAALGDNDEA